MRKRNRVPWAAAVAAELIAVAFCVSAQEQEKDRRADDPAATNAVRSADSPATPVPSNTPEPVQQVLQMLKAGVSTEVVKAYVEHSPLRYQLGAADLIALKQQSVPDEITTAMLKHQANDRVRLPARQLGTAGPDRTAPPIPQPQSVRSPDPDPESYDFWWYHYAYPRALAAANQRYWTTAPYSGSYWYYPYSPFAPHPPPRWAPAN